eukprot:759862-Hanusia_phi.AAC.2
MMTASCQSRQPFSNLSLSCLLPLRLLLVALTVNLQNTPVPSLTVALPESSCVAARRHSDGGHTVPVAAGQFHTLNLATVAD